MAFPGTHNISYYRGDTLEFKIYPKDSSGSDFSLATYNTTATFTISPRRGALQSGEQYINAYAEIIDGTYILCVIRPEDGQKMIAENSPYYYDIEIEDFVSERYLKLYTVLTGEISVTEQVTPGKDTPYPPDSITLGNVTDTSITVSWTPPIAGSFTGYAVGINSTASLTGATIVPLPATTTSYTFENLLPGHMYFVGVTALASNNSSSVGTFIPAPIFTDSES